MSKNLKDLIEQAEDEEKSQAQLEKTIERLELQVAKLETKLKAKKDSSKLEFVKPKKEKPESEEIVILKDLINSQKQELAQKQQEKEILQQNVEIYKQELKYIEDNQADSVKDQIIMKTQNSLNNLIEDYGRLEITNKSLKEEISRIENENEKLLDNYDKVQSDSSNVEKIERDLKNLNKRLYDLEREKKLLENINSTFRSKEISVEELEKTIEVFKINNLGLKKENQELSKIIDTAKADHSRLANFEEKVSYLEEKIIEVQKENEKLKQKDAILLAKTINVMEQENREHHTPADGGEVGEKDLQKIDEKVLKKSTEFVQTEELQSKIGRDFITTESIDRFPKITEPKDSKLEESVSTKTNDETGYRKKICPNCGNTNKAHIREIDDKTRVIFPGFYAKKYQCGQCATEWR
jgi:exonuclease SbcC